jgi:hypothetical protein
MPKLNLKVPKSLASDLESLASLGNDALSALVDRLQAHEGCIFKPAELRTMIDKAIAPPDAETVENVLMGLSALRRRSDASVEEILDGLSRGIAQYGWDAALQEGWDKIQPSLLLLLQQPSIVVTAKAVDLLYDYDHFFVGAKILSDLRPVFDDTKSQIVGATINHTLRMEFSDASGKQTDMSLVVNLDDIERLKKSCIDALKKGRTIESEIKEKWGIATLTIDEIKNDRN